MGLKLYKSEKTRTGRGANETATVKIRKYDTGSVKGSLNGKGKEFTSKWGSFIIALDETTNTHFLLAQKTNDVERVGSMVTFPETTPTFGRYNLEGITQKERKNLGASDVDFPLVLRMEFAINQD